MKVRPFRIPKQIVLPGIVVTVIEDSASSPALEGADGAWTYIEGAPRITLNSQMALTRKRYILLHELHHVIVDYLHTAMQDHPHKVKP